jgi:hypothetical protein
MASVKKNYQQAAIPSSFGDIVISSGKVRLPMLPAACEALATNKSVALLTTLVLYPPGSFGPIKFRKAWSSSWLLAWLWGNFVAHILQYATKQN